MPSTLLTALKFIIAEAPPRTMGNGRRHGIYTHCDCDTIFSMRFLIRIIYAVVIICRSTKIPKSLLLHRLIFIFVCIVLCCRFCVIDDFRCVWHLRVTQVPLPMQWIIIIQYGFHTFALFVMVECFRLERQMLSFIFFFVVVVFIERRKVAIYLTNRHLSMPCCYGCWQMNAKTSIVIDLDRSCVGDRIAHHFKWK